MKKKLLLSSLTIGLLSSVNVYAVEDLSAMFSEGKASGQIREFSISRAYKYTDSSKDYTRTANAVGGYLKYETASLEGLSLGTAFYTTNGFGLGGNKAINKEVDHTLLGKDNEGYSIVGEAYLQYKYGNTTFKGGRQKLDTPLAGTDDARMIPNLFEAYVLSNTDITNTTLLLAHVTKFAQGTFGRVYSGSPESPTNQILAATSGYSAVDDQNQVGDFVNMGNYAIGKTTDGVTAGAVIYKLNDNMNMQLWDYYAYDILNAMYGEINFKWNCLLSDTVHPFFSAQAIKENEIGDKLLGKVEGMYWGAKFGADIENFQAYLAYSQADENGATEASTQNAIITPWGGMPAYTQGMVTRHQFLAGTKASKIALAYNWKGFGPDLATSVYYTNFEMAKYNGYTADEDASESGFDVIYKPELVQNLSLRVRANFTTDYNVNITSKNTISWDEYRFIANYNF